MLMKSNKLAKQILSKLLKDVKETGQPEIAVRNDIMAEIVSTAFKTEVQALRNSNLYPSNHLVCKPELS